MDQARLDPDSSAKETSLNTNILDTQVYLFYFLEILEIE